MKHGDKIYRVVKDVMYIGRICEFEGEPLLVFSPDYGRGGGQLVEFLDKTQWFADKEAAIDAAMKKPREELRKLEELLRKG